MCCLQQVVLCFTERRYLNADHRVRPSSSSPIIDGDSLFLTFDGVDVQFIVALDKNTGDTLWLQHRQVGSDFAAVLRAEGITDTEKLQRINQTRTENPMQLVQPLSIQKEAVNQPCGRSHNRIYNPKTGEEHWRVNTRGYLNSTPI